MQIGTFKCSLQVKKLSNCFSFLPFSFLSKANYFDENYSSFKHYYEGNGVKVTKKGQTF